MLGVLFFTLSVSSVFASDIRFMKQINSLKEDLSFTNNDIVSLFERLEKLNQTILAKQLAGQSKADGDEYTVGKLPDMYNRELSALIKGFEAEKKIIRRDIQDINNRIDAGTNKCNTEFTNLLERTNLSLQSSEEVKALEKSHIDLRKELVLQTQLNAKLQNDFGAIKGEVLVLMKNVSTIIESLDRMTINTPSAVPVPPRPCQNKERSGVHYIFPDGTVEYPTHVNCDTITDGGGWIVIMRRHNGSLDFNRTWDEYKNGFGDVYGEFWIGNKFLHEFTKSKPMEMRVDIESNSGAKTFATYAIFQVGSEAEKYILTVSGYSGRSGDAFTHKDRGHNGMKFTTFDQDNDRNKNENCARKHHGGWWFDNCFSAMLTGRYTKDWAGRPRLKEPWFFPQGYNYVKFVDMKIR